MTWKGEMNTGIKVRGGGEIKKKKKTDKIEEMGKMLSNAFFLTLN